MERILTVGGRRLRVAVRPGTDPGRPPLLLCNGIGTCLSTFQRFVDALDPAIEVHDGSPSRRERRKAHTPSALVRAAQGT